MVLAGACLRSLRDSIRPSPHVILHSGSTLQLSDVDAAHIMADLEANVDVVLNTLFPAPSAIESPGVESSKHKPTVSTKPRIWEW